MTRVCDIESFLYDWAPRDLAMSWDNVGLLVGGGACGDYIGQAIALGCDTFVTSDLSYHEFLDTKGLNLIDAGHFPTENVVCPVLAERLQAAFPHITVALSAAHDREIIQYCIKKEK